ncbi:MAG: outer membrane protein assembly factor BamA [Elusimicrobiota bacterium]
MTLIKQRVDSLVITAILSVLFSQASVFAEESKKITDIVVEGTKTVSQRTVLDQLKVRKGSEVNEDVIKEETERVLELEGVEDAVPDIVEVKGKGKEKDRVKLVFKITERPRIADIKFKGNKQFSDGKLKGDLTLKKKGYYNFVKAEADRDKIISLYREKGFADCEAEYSTVDDPKSKKKILTFLITEGKRILVKDLIFNGNAKFKPKKIAGLMQTKIKQYFKKDVFDKDKEELVRFYKNNGFLNMQLLEPEFKYNDERTETVLIINIEEGPKFVVDEISFSGNSVIPEKELKAVLTYEKKQVFNQEKHDTSLALLHQMYADRGYLRAQVVPELIQSTDTGKVGIAFIVTENNIVYVNKIYVDGNTYTKTNVIDREILVKPGSPLLANKIRRTMERLNNLGFLEDAKIDIQPTENPDLVDVVFMVADGQPGMMSAGMGYSSTDKLVGTLQVQHMNLFGYGYRLNMQVEFGESKQNYEISFTDPWFLSKPIAFTSSISNTDSSLYYGTVSDAYKERRRGVALTFTPKLSEYMSLSAGYSFEQVDFYEILTEYMDKIYYSPDISKITVGVAYDKRDNIFDTNKGSRNSLSLQVAGGPLGAEAHFCKPIVSTAWFFPTFWKFVFSASAKVGYVSQYLEPDKQLLSEYFHIGGGDTVRGYDYGEIGPAGSSKYMTVCNFEYKFPLAMDNGKTMLQGAVFADIGGAWERPEDISLNIGNSANELKAGVGFGIRITTPVFPLRFDWGLPLNKPGVNQMQFYFTIGNMF